jgi:hypothetical protein
MAGPAHEPVCIASDVESRKVANIIAAAPAMLSALYDVMDEIDGRVDVVDTASGPGPNWAMQLLNRVESALRKAEGRHG